MTRPQVERIRDLMNTHVRDCLVTDDEDLIEALALSVTFGSIATGTPSRTRLGTPQPP